MYEPARGGGRGGRSFDGPASAHLATGLDDRDLIARAWARWGRDCPNHLLGDYAFAVWDRRARILFCARDHIGARPFYYARTVHGFAFASAVEAVLVAPGVDDRLDEGTVATWLVAPSVRHVGLAVVFHGRELAGRQAVEGIDRSCRISDDAIRCRQLAYGLVEEENECPPSYG